MIKGYDWLIVRPEHQKVANITVVFTENLMAITLHSLPTFCKSTTIPIETWIEGNACKPYIPLHIDQYHECNCPVTKTTSVKLVTLRTHHLGSSNIVTTSQYCVLFILPMNVYSNTNMPCHLFWRDRSIFDVHISYIVWFWISTFSFFFLNEFIGHHILSRRSYWILLTWICWFFSLSDMSWLAIYRISFCFSFY